MNTSYKWDADDYAKHSSQQQLWARELIAKLKLTGSESVLDIGCGDGKVTAVIASRLPGGSVLGVDNSAEMITLAQQRFPPASFPNLRFQQEDARSLDFVEQFTVIFSNAALHWVRDHRPVLEGIARSLKPGGTVLLQMGGKGNAVDVGALLHEFVGSPRWAGHFAAFVSPFGFHGPDEYATWLRQVGLTPLRVELIPKDMVHQGREGFAGWLRTTHLLPYLQFLPQSEREPFLDEFIAAYLAAHPIDERGKVHVGMVRLEVEAAKV